ncbi:hypothetical protein [Flavobacterium sp. W22_SRS_FP1]|uniref:hypothetical protein n=1 Tax=Flavobacterium sp. W22_SRS_FP1 TaxID=3240276 RepID=UPI003F8DECAC
MNDKHSNKLLASYALFKGLFDLGKDIYGVIAEYLKKTISDKGLYNFTLDEITQILNNDFEFNIPNAVVKTSLNRIDNLTRIGASYTVNNPNDYILKDFNEFEQDYEKKNETIIQTLIKYVEEIKQKKLDEKEQTALTHSFCNYILDRQNGNESLEYITSFILIHESESDFKEQIDKIREGVILYSGIKFNNDLNNFGAWNSEFTIYIETEILFHLAGFNGELYKILASDLLQFITEINQKAGKRIIKLKYFEDVKIEIEGFFTKAKYLLEGNSKPNPSVTAMVTIINGCKSISDIQAKKTDFYELLKRNLIEEDDYSDYFAERNHKYNIVSKELIGKISKDLDRDATPYLKYLNYISIHRKEAFENNFENVKAILLSGNSTTLKVAWIDLLKEEGNVPLATTMSFLTNKFWFKLNKGFGKNSLPKSFDIISKSQIILSTILNKKIGFEYEDLQEQFKQGKLNEEQVKARLVDLKNNVRKPEDIVKDNIDDVLQVITEDSLDKFIEEQKHFKSKAEQHSSENADLKIKLAKKEESESELENDLKESKELFIIEKTKQFKVLKKIKEPIDKIAKKKYNYYKIILAILFVLSFVCAYFFIFLIDWKNFDKYSYFIGFTPTFIFIFYFLITEKEIKPLKALENHLISKKNNEYFKNYKKFNFNIEEFEELQNEINSKQ